MTPVKGRGMFNEEVIWDDVYVVMTAWDDGRFSAVYSSSFTRLSSRMLFC